ncbi:hypothetical protein BC830DRAFT_1091516 [Chytriomyces sp. MP71]|nr:hypothetical protein BC830DRAFT_1091516 [Chytriomyces sp. MP71]
MNSTNVTYVGPGNPFISDAQFAILGVVLGMTIEISFTGIITTICRVLQGAVTAGSEFFVVGVIMTGFNVACIVYQSLQAWVFFLSPDQCVSGSTIGNVFSHIFNLAFDSFMLYKTYCVSEGDSRVQYSAYVILLHRLGWAIGDIVSSKSVWDESLQTCLYMQNSVTTNGYNSSDMVSHLFATVLAFIFGFINFEGNLSGVGKALVDGNILRSLIIVGIHSYAMYADQYFYADAYASAVALLVQAYVLARCVNAELFYSIGRMSYSRAAQKSVVSSQGAYSAARSETGEKKTATVEEP